MIFDYLFLPALTFIAGITAYQDLKYGKIKNKWIILGLSYGLVVIALLFAWDLLAQPLSKFYYLKIKQLAPDSSMPVFTVSFSYLLILIVNFLISVVASFLMWRFRAWSAGDAKLFFAFSLLLPLKYYSKTYLPFWPSFVLLVNIFIPVFVFFTIKASVFLGQSVLTKIREKKLTSEVKKSLKSGLADILRLFIVFVSMFLFTQLFQQQLGAALSLNSFFSQILTLSVLFLISKPLTKYLKKKMFLIMAVLFLLAGIIYGWVYHPSSLLAMFYKILLMASIFLVLIGLLRKILDFYIKEEGVQEISSDELKANSQISKEFMLGFKKESPEIYDYLVEMGKKKSFSQTELVAFKKYCLERKIKTIKIYKSFPFAVWMTLGLVITLIVRGSILSLIYKML